MCQPAEGRQIGGLCPKPVLKNMSIARFLILQAKCRVTNVDIKTFSETYISFQKHTYAQQSFDIIMAYRFT